MGPITSNKFNRVSKGWGHEIWITNNEKYCGKLLHFNEGKICSWHYHKLKEEHFYVASGVIEIIYGEDDDKKRISCCNLYTGDGFHVPIGLRHQMKAVGGDAEIFEFSTTHFDTDSYRIEEGD